MDKCYLHIILISNGEYGIQYMMYSPGDAIFRTSVTVAPHYQRLTRLWTSGADIKNLGQLRQPVIQRFDFGGPNASEARRIYFFRPLRELVVVVLRPLSLAQTEQYHFSAGGCLRPTQARWNYEIKGEAGDVIEVQKPYPFVWTFPFVVACDHLDGVRHTNEPRTK